MEIIRRGLTKEERDSIYFECSNCGCIFKMHKADKGYEFYSSASYRAKCPNCKEWAIDIDNKLDIVFGMKLYNSK